MKRALSGGDANSKCEEPEARPDLHTEQGDQGNQQAACGVFG